jgi:3D (Asp-Asp-Asp) domain-containing protein
VNVDNKWITPPNLAAYADALSAAKQRYSKKNGSPRRVGLDIPNVNEISNIDSSRDSVSKVLSFSITQYPQGGKNNKLIPYHSIAVNPKMPLGSQVFIRELQNRKLPDGTLHDGWVSADDHGGAIKGNRLDFFADERNKNFLEGLVHIYVHGQ